MSDPYGKVKSGRLTFKGGDLASRSKPIDKKNKKKKKKQHKLPDGAVLDGDAAVLAEAEAENSSAAPGEEIYTIDPMKKMKYDDLFPVEAKKFGYELKEKAKSVEEALDDRVKKKADRYCK